MHRHAETPVSPFPLSTKLHQAPPPPKQPPPQSLSPRTKRTHLHVTPMLGPLGRCPAAAAAAGVAVAVRFGARVGIGLRIGVLRLLRRSRGQCLLRRQQGFLARREMRGNDREAPIVPCAHDVSRTSHETRRIGMTPRTLPVLTRFKPPHQTAPTLKYACIAGWKPFCTVHPPRSGRSPALAAASSPHSADHGSMARVEERLGGGMPRADAVTARLLKMSIRPCGPEGGKRKQNSEMWLS